MRSLDETALTVVARSSELSKAQVVEVADELKQFHPLIEINPIFVQTIGDKDLKTSLLHMEKTDFFTREVDEVVLRGHARAAIHSAKDLPSALPKGLYCAALTRGVDNSDVLVFRDGEGFDSLKDGDKIATSSMRRSEMIFEMGRQFQIVDIRGTIQQRLALLDTGDVDAIVMAEAALIRLRLQGKSRMKLTGPVAELQGQLAVMVREDDAEMIELFSCIDTRKSMSNLP
jgi:hydroxymethylbilane synthase